MYPVCKTCKVPSIVSRDHIWLPNGTIVAEKVPTFRLIILEVDNFNKMYSELEALFGKVIPNSITHGTRKNAKIYVDGLLKGPLGFIARSRFGSKKVYDALVDTCLALGYGKPQILGYERGKSIKVDMIGAAYPPHFLGDLRGAFESVEKKPTRGTWTGEAEGTSHIIVEVTEKADPLDDIFDYKEVKHYRAGDIYSACKSCGLPVDLSRFQWDQERFWIMDTVHDQRVFIIGYNDMLAIMHEIERLVGEFIREKVRDIAIPFGRTVGERKGEKAFELFEKDMRIKGWGYATVERIGKTFKWNITNPFYTPILEGKLTGIYDAVFGRMPEVKTEKKEGVLTIEMR